MKHHILIVAIWVCTGLLLAQTPLNLPLPQFSNPFYDAFSINYLGTSALGRGYTGVADLGDIGLALLNPASVLPDSAQLMVEMNFKAAIEAEGYPMYAQYTAPVPFGLVAVGGELGANFSAGVVYSVPKSISLNDFAFYINMGGDMIQRFPSYYLHQVTANLGYHQGPLHVGLNLHNQIHYNDDPIFLRTYDRVRDYKYNYRVQPGIVYELGKAALGVSIMPPSRFNWDLKYTTYDAILPLWISAGMEYGTSEYRGLLDAEWEQDSAINASFADRITLKAGAEKHSGPYVYRLGYHYNSSVFSGIIKLPSNNFATADTSLFWNDIPTTINIADNAQHSISIGFSYYHKVGVINLGAMQTIIADIPKTQINLSLSFYLSSFRPKSRILYDE